MPVYSDIIHPDTRKFLVSNLAAFSGLILTTSLIIFFTLRYYALETLLLPRLYGRIYFSLNERARRGFVNHHISGVTKFLLLALTAYPYCMVIFKVASFHTPIFKGSRLTMGDAMVIAAQIFTAMYIHELIYRSELSIIAVLHHVGTAIIAQVGVALTLMKSEWHLAGIEFILCMTWGTFDVIFEGWVHGVIIVHRVYPDNHLRFRNWSRAACIGTGIGTLVETIVVMYLFGIYWDRWSISFKVLTPILHAIFSAAQIWGTKNYWQMWKTGNARLAEAK